MTDSDDGTMHEIGAPLNLQERLVTVYTTATIPPAAGRVVVTGAAGFIASHLTDALLVRGHDVVAVDRRSVADDVLAASHLGSALGHPRLRLRLVDLTCEDLDEVVANADVVFHLAALPGVRESWGPRFADYVASNILVTDRVLAACERARVRRLVFASSSSVYGSSGAPSREDGPTGPLSPYGVTKLAAEHLCLAHARRPGTSLTATVLRYFTVYGPRQRPGMAIGRMLLAAVTGVPVPLFGDGRQCREFTYVDDVVAATIAAAFAPDTNTVINVGGGASVSVLDIISRIGRLSGREVPLVTAAPQAGDPVATRADLSRAREMLGYRPAVDLDEGLARHLRWLTDLPDAVRDQHLAHSLEVVR